MTFGKNNPMQPFEKQSQHIKWIQDYQQIIKEPHAPSVVRSMPCSPVHNQFQSREIKAHINTIEKQVSRESLEKADQQSQEDF